MVELRELSESDGLDIFDMLKEIGQGENGFVVRDKITSLNEFSSYLKKQFMYAKGIGLESQYVPQTTYWLIVDSVPVGVVRLRHYLNDNLRKLGGNIGYTIRPSERGKGYGNLLLGEVLVKAKNLGLDKVLLTCDKNNIRSRKVIEANGGILSEIDDGECKYWIKL